jgi:WD40 repeat protein
VRAAPRIFISYSRQDASEMAAALRLEFERAGLSVWQDISALEGGHDWWSQIEDALRAKTVQHFVLVLTPGSLGSQAVRREIRLARQEGKTVIPIRGPGLDDLAQIPRWVGQVMELAIPEHRQTVLRTLALNSVARRVPMMAPEPPADYVTRPAIFEAIKAQLVDSAGDGVSHTVALRGAGGYGKTTLASVLAHDSDIQDAYFDGILWVELGADAHQRLVPLISDLVTLIEGQVCALTTINAARTAFGQALGDRRFLLIVDDVWDRNDLSPFLHAGKNVARVITTRFDRELPREISRQQVDAMDAGEARTLLSRGLPEHSSAAASSLAALASRLGDWPHLLKLGNGFLRDRVAKHRLSLERAIADLNTRFDACGFTALDDVKALEYNTRHRSAGLVIRTSLELLDTQSRARFEELGVFPEGIDIPVGIVARLWADTGKLGEIATEDLLTELYDLSLLLALDLDRRVTRLHDTIREFLREESGSARLTTHHKLLAESMHGLRDATPIASAEAQYYFRYVGEHLAASGATGTLRELLLDPAWLSTWARASTTPASLVSDFRRLKSDPDLSLVRRVLELTITYWSTDPAQIVPQLLGRASLATESPVISEFVETAHRFLSAPALVPATASFADGTGAETRRFMLGSDVRALVRVSPRVLVAGTSDGRVLTLDVEDGEARLVTQMTAKVRAFAVLPNRRVAICFSHGPVQVWNPNGATITTHRIRLRTHAHAIATHSSGRVLVGAGRALCVWSADLIPETELDGHSGELRSIALLRDGRVITGSTDRDLRVWSIETGQSRILRGHTGPISCVLALQDGHVLSSAEDRTLRVWNLEEGSSRVLQSGLWIRSLAELEDGRILIGYEYGGLRTLSPDLVGEPVPIRTKHPGQVRALQVLEPDLVATACSDGGVRLVRVDGVDGTRSRRAHRRRVTSMTSSGEDEAIVSGSADGSVRRWSPANMDSNLIGNQGAPVTTIAPGPGGQVLSGADDGTISVWGAPTGSNVLLGGHTSSVTCMTRLDDCRIASGAFDGDVRVWDLTARESLVLRGHEGAVSALTALPDGCLLSGGRDGTVRTWNPPSNEGRVLLDHGSAVSALARSEGGRIVIGGSSGIVRVADAHGSTIATLRGHDSRVGTLLALADERVVTAFRDGCLLVWDPSTGASSVLRQASIETTCVVAVDDRWLVSAGLDATVRLWSIDATKEDYGEDVCRFVGDAPIHCMAKASRSQVLLGDSMGGVHSLKLLLR